MQLIARAKEQYLIGCYTDSLASFARAQAQIEAYVASLAHAMEHGAPSDFEAAEKLYSEWQHCLDLLEAEFGAVQQILNEQASFRGAPGEKVGLASPPALSDAQLQAQHLAAQQAMDIRDPDVWPPPTPQEPSANAGRHVKQRSSMAGGGGGQWNAGAAVVPSRPPPAAANVPSRTPMKPPQAAISSIAQGADDDGGAPSGRLPNWAARGGAAPVTVAAAPAPRPVKLVRKASQPPQAIASQVSQPSAVAAAAAAADPPQARRAGRASMAPGRKPAVPKVGRKDSAAAASKKGGSKDDGGEESNGGRPKFEAATKEEQEMADMIEREILDKSPNVKMDDIAGLAGAKQLLSEAVVLPRLIPGYFTGKRKPWKGVLMFGPPGTGQLCRPPSSAMSGSHSNVSTGLLICVTLRVCAVLVRQNSPGKGRCHRVWHNFLQHQSEHGDEQVPRRQREAHEDPVQHGAILCTVDESVHDTFAHSSCVLFLDFIAHSSSRSVLCVCSSSLQSSWTKWTVCAALAVVPASTRLPVA
jgi:hypothetical protein